jgi:carbonic anhydrase
LIQSIISRVQISVDKHNSVGIAIVGHYDCAGNPSKKEQQLVHLEDSVESLRQYFDIPIIALWVDKNWNVNEI